jgi:hypothetical protein
MAPPLALGIEFVLRAIRAHLIANLGAQITAIEALASAASYPDLDLLTPTAADYLVGAGQWDALSGNPGKIAVEIEVERLNWHGRNGITTGDRVAEVKIYLGIIEPTGKRENLAYRQARYAAALEQVFLNDPTCGGTTAGKTKIVQATPGVVEYGGLVQQAQSPLYTSLALAVEVHFQVER